MISRKTAIAPNPTDNIITIQPRTIETLPRNSTFKASDANDTMIKVANNPPKILSGLIFMVLFQDIRGDHFIRNGIQQYQQVVGRRKGNSFVCAVLEYGDGM